MTQDLAIFKAMSAKMTYLDTRQKVLAGNISNADTPGYRPKDLGNLDFGSMLDKVSKSSASSVRMATTHKNHVPVAGSTNSAEEQKRKATYEVAPAGNAVNLEEEIIKASQNTMDYNMMTNLYSKHIGMMRTALGN